MIHYLFCTNYSFLKDKNWALSNADKQTPSPPPIPSPLIPPSSSPLPNDLILKETPSAPLLLLTHRYKNSTHKSTSQNQNPIRKSPSFLGFYDNVSPMQMESIVKFPILVDDDQLISKTFGKENQVSKENSSISFVEIMEKASSVSRKKNRRN